MFLVTIYVCRSIGKRIDVCYSHSRKKFIWIYDLSIGKTRNIEVFVNIWILPERKIMFTLNVLQYLLLEYFWNSGNLQSFTPNQKFTSNSTTIYARTWNVNWKVYNSFETIFKNIFPHKM